MTYVGHSKDIHLSNRESLLWWGLSIHVSTNRGYLMWGHNWDSHRSIYPYDYLSTDLQIENHFTLGKTQMNIYPSIRLQMGNPFCGLGHSRDSIHAGGGDDRDSYLSIHLQMGNPFVGGGTSEIRSIHPSVYPIYRSIHLQR